MDITEYAEAVRRRQQATPTVETLLGNAIAGTQRLAQLAGAWNNTAPTPAALSDALNATQGIRLMLLAIETQIQQSPQNAA
jgi:hypothetical protein